MPQATLGPLGLVGEVLRGETRLQPAVEALNFIFPCGFIYLYHDYKVETH